MPQISGSQPLKLKYKTLQISGAGFVCYTSSVLRGGRHVKQKGRIYALLLGSGLKVAKVEDCKGFLQKFGIAEVEDCRSLAQLRPFH